MHAKTILLVDDDTALRDGLQVMLQQSGYQTLEAEDGTGARDLIHKYQPDLVILDMMMPRWGGFAVLEHFQGIPEAPPFIMLTGDDGETHKAYAKKIGVVDYLIKPYSLERLVKKVDGFFWPAGKQSAESETSLTRDAWTLKPGRDGRVLLASVHKPLARAVMHGLEDEGFYVETAQNAADAAIKAGDFSYDIVVLDLMFLNADGWNLLKEFRAKGVPSEILVLAAKNSTEDKVKGLNLGADDCLARPFQLAELLARLRALYRRRRFVPEPMLQIADLELSLTARTVKHAGQSISLTPREFDLLLLLARNRGQVVTRAMIWEKLYPDTRPNTSNVIDVYVRYVRAKIDSGFDKKLIRTIWGEGYQIDAD